MKIIASKINHDKIISYLLKKQVAVNADVVTLTNFLNNLIINDSDNSLYLYDELIKKMSLKHFAKMQDDPNFLRELQSFVKTLKLYDIDSDDLSDNDEYFKELKMIIKELYSIKLPIDVYQKTIESLIVDDEIYIIDDLFAYEDYILASKIVEKGAQFISLKQVDDVEKTYQVFLNKKNEVEGLARYLLNNKIDVNDAKLTLADSSYLPFVRQIFNYYNIPLNLINYYKSSRLANKYLTLINYYENPTHQNLVNLINEEVFNDSKVVAFGEYISLFEYDLDDNFKHIQEADISTDIINKYEYEELVALEKAAQDGYNYLYEDLKTLINLTDYESIINKVDDIIIKNHRFDTLYKMQELNQIRTILKDSIPYQNLKILKIKLANIKINLNDKNAGLLVLSDEDYHFVTKYHFILGADNNFMQFKTLKGIFNENYIKSLKYPSLIERYNYFQNKQVANLKTSEKLYISYSTNEFDGKEHKSSLFIDDFMEQKAIYQNIQYPYQNFNNKDQIDPKIASALFLKDGVLKGSISSLERYSNCPFSYFIERGLKIRQRNDYAYNSAKNGTLVHYVLEELVKKYHDEYAEASLEVIDKILESKLVELIAIYPNLKDQLLLAKKRLLILIAKTLKYLKEIENGNKLEKHVVETVFEEKLNIDDITLELKGIIDRIDYNNDFIAIIDYKSSNKELSEKNFLSCLQLQLITYLVVVSRKANNHKMVGAYYYNFGRDRIKGKAYELKKKDVISGEDSYLELKRKNHKLSGWTFTDFYEVIDAVNNVKGFKLKKDGTLDSRTKIYDLEGVEQALILIYEAIINNLKAGNIAISPNSCQFCSYHHICHYSGSEQSDKDSIDLGEIKLRKE